MKQLVYYVATTLDGFIAREDGSFDDFPWDEAYVRELLSMYPETFPAHLREGLLRRSDNERFDTVLMGRATYEVALRQGITSPYPTLDQFLFSTTMADSPSPEVTLIKEDAAAAVASLKGSGSGAIWLCGGSTLATTLFEAGLIDELIIKLNPIVFGSGIPLFSRPIASGALELRASRPFPSGHVLLNYAVGRER